MIETLMFLGKLFLSVASGGILFSNLKNSIENHRSIFTMVAVVSLVAFAFSTMELVWHIKEKDNKYPLAEMVINKYIVKDEDTIYWTENPKSLDFCRDYLIRYPQGKYAEKATQLIESFIDAEDAKAFAIASSTDTIPAYQQYLTASRGNRRTEAESRIKALELIDHENEVEWKQILKNRQGCESYLALHANSRFSDAARNCIKIAKSFDDNERFKIARMEDSIDSYQDYLKNCRENTCENAPVANKHLLSLQEPLEAANWSRISSTPTLEECRDHLAKYPGGKNAASARTCVERYNLIAFCAKNEAAAQAAQEAAIKKYGGRGGGATALGCSSLVLLGILDWGASAITCYVTGATGTAVTAKAAGDQAYKTVRNVKCLDVHPFSLP